MTNVFMTVLRMSATGSLVILAVLLVRLCLKGAPKRWSWLLWAIVLLRLLTPFGIPVSVALPAGLPADLPDFPQRAETAPAAAEETPATDFSVSSTVEAENETTPIQLDPDLLQEAQGVPVPSGVVSGEAEAPSSAASGNTGDTGNAGRVKWVLSGLWLRARTAAPFVWLAGAMLMTGWNLAAFRMLKNRLAEAVPTGVGKGEVYETDRVDSAFVVGLIRPKIYLPAGLSMVEQACVVAHERTHIRRGDPWWRLLSFAALTVHWFNPLVWLAFRLSGKDMEMSCDEAVLSRTPVDIRAAYSRTLVKFASRGRIEGPALAFGEGETGSRVKNVMKYKKPVLWVSVAAAAVLVLSGVVLAMNVRAESVSLPHTRYTVKETHLSEEIRTLLEEKQESPEEHIARINQMTLMLAGDDMLFADNPDNSVWSPVKQLQDWVRGGEIIDGIVPGVGSAEEAAEMIRTTSGVRIGRIEEAKVGLIEPEKTDYLEYYLLFSTADGRVWFASIENRGTADGTQTILLRLKAEEPLPEKADLTFFRQSLLYPYIDFCGDEHGSVSVYRVTKDTPGRYVVLFTAGILKKDVELRNTASESALETPFHFGIAVFLPEADGKGLRLADWEICPDTLVTHSFRSADPSKPQEPGTVLDEAGLTGFTFVTDDGRTVRAELTLPEKKRTLFGETFEGECEIRFLPAEGMSAEDIEEQLAEAREEGKQQLQWEQNLEKLQEQLAEEQRAEEENARREEIDRQTREKIDAAYDAFLTEHYELEDLTSHLAAYATRRIDLNADGWNELVVYRMPTESSYPLDIYEYDRNRDEVRAFHTSLEGIPASLNADPEGFYCAQIGEHDADSPDGFYGDFFRVNGETFLISMDGSEYWKKIVCHAFSSVTNRLAAQTVFSAERCGEWYFDEAKRNRAFVNGQEIAYSDFNSALLEWRSTWLQRSGGAGEWICQEPLWDESEQSGWPFGWLKDRNDEKNGKTTARQWETPDGQLLFTLSFPAGWDDNVVTETGEWVDDPKRGFCMRIDFYDRLEHENGTMPGLLGSLVLYRHNTARFYPTAHRELQTLTLPDGESYDLALVFPGDVQYWDYADHYSLWLTKLKNVAAGVDFPREEGYRTTIAPERAMLLLHDALVRAYENTYGTFEPLSSDPTSEEAAGFEDRLYLRFVITRLTLADGRTGAYEDDEFYYFPILFPFAVSKRGGDIFKVHEGRDPATNAAFTWYTPFSWNAPDAFGELGNTEPEGQSVTHSEGPSQGPSQGPSEAPPEGQTDAGPEGGTLWTSPTGLFSLDLPEGFLDAVEVRTGEQWEGGSDEPEYWASFVLKDPEGGDGVLGSLVLYPHMLERYYVTGRQEFSTLTFADGRSFEFVLVLPEDPARSHPWYPLGIAAHYLSQLRTAAVSAKFPEGTRVTVSPGNAADSLATGLIKAYVNTYGHEPDLSIAEDPSPCPDEEYLCYAINRILTGTLGAKGAWEDENYYWFPVIFPFAVDKESGAIYKVYEGWDPITKSGYTNFIPFDPYDPNALAFAG